MGQAAAKPAPVRARLCIVAATILWSSGSVFAKVLREDTALGLNAPLLEPSQIASFRVLCAGVLLLPLLRRRDFSFRPMMVFTAACFALMNWAFLTAISYGTAANAILLQSTAPLWMYLVSVYCLREPVQRRAGVSLVIGVTGIGVILWGGWQGAQLKVLVYALGSGFFLAGVYIGLRLLHNASALLLTTINLLFGGLVLLPTIWDKAPPVPAQVGVLFLYGGLQMALPYWLMAKGLRHVSPQEAGTLTLLEPLLASLWAYLLLPDKETPGPYTLVGGSFILGALAYRYWPWPATRET